MKRGVRLNSWIVFPKPNRQACIRLFCFPYAGGGAAVYGDWSDALPSEVEVFRVQSPGRENRLREQPFTRLQPFVETLANVVRPYLDMPFSFFGHSVGALVCFELARYLRKQDGLSPALLFVSGRGAPHIPGPDPPIHQLPETEFVEEVRSRYDGIPEAVLQDAELMQLILPVLRADMAVSETYVYENDDPLGCPISVFGGLQDRKVRQQDLPAWRDLTRSSFTLRMFPGNHFFLQGNRTPLLQALADDLK